jgi:type II secretory pathway pseudopilin PulG
MRTAPLLCRIHARLHSDERGFTMVEAMVAGMILAIGAFAVAQSLQFGLKQTGMARQRAAAQALANHEMELARALNFTNVALRNSQAGDLPSHSTDPSSPDYWVSSAPPLCFDPDGSGSLPCEPIVAIASSPSLIHHQTDVTDGSTTFTIDRYVTWVDSPVDGCVAVTTTCTSTNPDQNTNGADANGQDMKRVTVIAAWPNVYGTVVSQLRISSLFSTGTIPYHGTNPVGTQANQPPVVECPLYFADKKVVSFSARASDPDGTVVQIDWDFGAPSDAGDTVANGGVNQTHTYKNTGTYQITNTVFDNSGAIASNASLSCQITVTNDTSGGDDFVAPTGTPVSGCGTDVGISIACNATYTTTLQVGLNLSAIDNVGVTKMQFSDDGVNFGAAVPYSSTTQYTLPTGDGTKYVYVKFIDDAGNVSLAYFDGIVLDTTPPAPPTGVTATRGTVKSGKVDITVQWNAPSPSPSDLAGYRIYRLISTSSTYTQIGGNLSTSTLSYVDASLNSSLGYTYCVVSFDNAGNQSAAMPPTLPQGYCVGPI